MNVWETKPGWGDVKFHGKEDWNMNWNELESLLRATLKNENWDGSWRMHKIWTKWEWNEYGYICVGVCMEICVYVETTWKITVADMNMLWIEIK